MATIHKNRLRELRENRKMLITDLAEATGVKSNTISMQETFKRAIPVETAVIYADFFEVSLDFLFCREEYESELQKYKTHELEEFLDILEKEVAKRHAND